MTSVPRVFTSGDVLGSAAGTDVHLSTVETWGGRVVVRMAGALNEASRADEVGHEARMQDGHGRSAWPARASGRRRRPAS